MKPKQPEITIASLIRERLKQSPATCGEVWKYTHKQNAPFRVSDYSKQKKSIRGQLTKMKSRGEVTNRDKIWYFKK